MDIPSSLNRILQRPLVTWTLLLASVALSLVLATRLRIRTDLVALLPEESPAATSYRLFLEEFDGLEKVFVMILPGSAREARQADLAQAAVLLEEALRSSPTVASVRAGVTDEDETFLFDYVLPRAPLLLSGDWESEVSARIEPSAIHDRARVLKEHVVSPLSVVERPFLVRDPLGFFALPSSTGGGLGANPLTATFEAPGGNAALVIVTPSGGELDAEFGRDLLAELERGYAQVRKEVGVPLRFFAIGGPLYAAHDEEALRSDLRRTVSSSALVTGLLLAVAFRGWRVPLAMLAPLAAGLIWASGMLGLVRPEVAAATIGFSAVIIGLGLDYAIHTATRLREMKLAGVPRSQSVAVVIRGAGPGILASAVTTAGGFGVLALADFRPLRDLGLLVPLGLLSILAATALVGLSTLPWAARQSSEPGWLWNRIGHAVAGTCELASRRPRMVLGVAFGLSLLAVIGLRAISFDADLSGLRSASPELIEGEKILSGDFGFGLATATALVPGRDRSEALVSARNVSERFRLSDQVVEVTSPADFLAGSDDPQQRLAALRAFPLDEAADLLSRELTDVGLSPAAFSPGIGSLRALGRGADPGEGYTGPWPSWISDSLRVKAEGTWVAVNIRLKDGAWPDGPPPSLLSDLEEQAPGTAVASTTALGAEIRSLVIRDFRYLGVVSLAVVGTLVLLSFRGDVARSLVSLIPVLLGVVWTLGIGTLLGLELDVFSLSLMPILLGIGIDDGLHVMHTIKAEGKDVGAALASVGHALVLTTLTTAIGFGSLVFSSIPALRSGGALLAGGVLCCLFCTLTVLPAIGRLYPARV